MGVLGHLVTKDAKGGALVHCLFNGFGQFQIFDDDFVHCKAKLSKLFASLVSCSVTQFTIVGCKVKGGDFALTDKVGQFHQDDALEIFLNLVCCATVQRAEILFHKEFGIADVESIFAVS